MFKYTTLSEVTVGTILERHGAVTKIEEHTRAGRPTRWLYVGEGPARRAVVQGYTHSHVVVAG